jgi:hypothetical protein
MRILNPKLEESLGKEAIKLDLGCGRNKREGFYAVDHLELEGVDVVADLNEPLHLLPNGCSEYIYSRHALEHVTELLSLMREIYRISRPNSTVEIVVPHFSNVYGYSDPTHVRFFGLYSMYYFVSPENQPQTRRVPAFYTDARFVINSLTIEFYRSGIIDRVLAPIFFRLVNLNIHTQDFYERRLSHLFHAWQIRYILTPEK